MVTVGARLSTDPGNLLSFGSDQGLFLTSGASATSDTSTWTIDNSDGGSGTQWIYSMMTNSASSYALPTGNAQVWPFMVTRATRVTDAQIYIGTGGPAGSRFNVSVFASAPNGAVGSKIVDLMYFLGQTTGFIRASVLSPSTVFAPHTLYWMLSWTATTGANPAIYCRTASVNGMVGVRWTSIPTVQQNLLSPAACYVDTSAGWASINQAPSTISPTQLSPGTQVSNPYWYPPHILWGLTNT